MINLIFKTKESYNVSPNSLLPINNDYNYKGSNCCFGALSKTNVFIGENNSGKSRFLRNLFETEFSAICDEQIDRFLSETGNYAFNSGEIEKLKSKITQFNRIYESNGRDAAPYGYGGNDFFSKLKKHSISCSKTDRFYFPIIRGTKDYQTVINKKLETFISQSPIQNKDSINHYISLLNLEAQGLESFDVYNEIIKHEYFRDDKSLGENILTGGKLYKEIKSMLLGEESQRKTIEDFQIFLRDTFFSDYDKVQLIPNEQKKVLYVKIGKDERAIYNWGDGTQQLIIILFSLFKHKDEQNKLFFIEEPELYLHPGVLRKFIEVINSDIFKNHQYFITTHSNIVLDTSADNVSMSIFKFKKVKDATKNNGKPFLIEQCNNGDVSLLNELGVRNSSVFLSNCSIWVEGITDRLYLKHYLKLYVEHLNKEDPSKKEYRENIDYTFIEYGGSNLVHFNFGEDDISDSINAKYINSKIFLIADNDNTEEGTDKAIRKARLREQLGENFYELTVKEIENLITQETLRKVLIVQNPKKEKEINKAFDVKYDFEHESLGEFVDLLFTNDEIKKYAAESGTIKNKLAFCKTVIEVTKDYDDLSDEAKKLTEKVYTFIKKNNEI
ncbi:MAG: AAA family ATPase [Clostridiales bacterium]|nr:AAA family ATPase [Clostridiales bacterium]